MKLSAIYKFYDGTTLEWLDKESLKYTDNGYVVIAWVDYGPGLFKINRVLKLESLTEWSESPNGSERIIDEQKRKEIILKIQLYYAEKKVRCVIET